MFNQCTLVGRMVADPEMRETNGGVPVASYRIAVDRPQSSEARNSGQEKETDFFNITSWRQAAEFIGNWGSKGRLVLVNGRIQIRDYTDKDGNARKATEIITDSVKFLDRKPDEGGEEGGSQFGGGQQRGGGNQGGGRVDSRGSQGGRNPLQGGGNQGGAPARKPAGRALQTDDEDELNDPFAE